MLAAIEDTSVARAILECLGLPARAPPATSARTEPNATLPDLDEAFDFDQTSPYEKA